MHSKKENHGNLGRANKDWLVLIPSSLIMYLYIHNNRITKQNTIRKTSGMDGWKERRKKKKIRQEFLIITDVSDHQIFLPSYLPR